MENEDLINHAIDLLESGEFQEAGAIARSLIEEDHLEGYEIMTEILVHEEDHAAALELQKQATQKFPDSWKAWLQYGTFLSEQEELDGALEAFAKGKTCSGAEEDWFTMNEAIIDAKQYKLDDALNKLQSIKQESLLPQAMMMQFQLLDGAGQHSLILEIAEDDLETLPDPEDELQAETVAMILTYVAIACWQEERPGDERLFYLRQAIELDRNNEQAIWLWREAMPEFSDDAQIYNIMVQGMIGVEKGQKEMFLSAYEVVADSQEEALQYVKDYEIEPIEKDSLSIIEVEIEEVEEGEAKGIYNVGGFAFITQN